MNYRRFSTPAFLSCAITFLCSYVHPHDKQKEKKEKENDTYDVIIVPGVPYEDPAMKLILKSRILWAKYLYETKTARNIIFSGSSVYTPYVEGHIMRIYADSLRIPSKHTFSETQAEHSTENIYYSVLMARRLGFKKIAVATDQYQAVILNLYIRKNFPEVEILPIDYEKINLFTAYWPEIDETPAFVENFVSLVKRENQGKRFKGTLGRNVNDPANDSTYENTRTPLISGLLRMVKPAMSTSPFLSVIYHTATKQP
ncbi:MAG: YdcF family protein [Bacteroidetes bacterium]|nr:YdcF family protein [Bacteroidota bacterium]